MAEELDEAAVEADKARRLSALQAQVRRIQTKLREHNMRCSEPGKASVNSPVWVKS